MTIKLLSGHFYFLSKFRSPVFRDQLFACLSTKKQTAGLLRVNEGGGGVLADRDPDISFSTNPPGYSDWAVANKQI